MSLYDYRASLQIAAEDYPFYALIMAAMRQADTANLKRLKEAFPETWAELERRYHVPGGVLPEDEKRKTPGNSLTSRQCSCDSAGAFGCASPYCEYQKKMPG